jgi:Leucine-rich repeat (LRR) protein
VLRPVVLTLAGLTALTTLQVSHNLISDPTPIVALVNLTSLDASYNALSDASAIGTCTSLQRLGDFGMRVQFNV